MCYLLCSVFYLMNIFINIYASLFLYFDIRVQPNVYGFTVTMF